MVEYLKISNLALLKEAQLEFSGGFTVVTGETGAGKSVLLGALSMLAGNRCGREIVGKASDTCKVEAVLHFKDPSKINAYLEGNGIPACEEGVLVIARTVSREKSGRAFVNRFRLCRIWEPIGSTSMGRGSPRNFSLCATSFRCWIHLPGYKICRMHI